MLNFLFAVFVFADPLPSWNEGQAKTAIVNFVQKTTDPSDAHFVPLEERVAAFDQDGTLWVEQPLYIQLLYCLDRIKGLASKQPDLKIREPFKTALSGDHERIAKLSLSDFEKIAIEAITGMSTEEFHNEVATWLSSARDERFNRLYTELTYLPMLEVLKYFRDNGYKTYIVTGGGQDFVRVFAEKAYGIPPENVVGSAIDVKYSYDANGKPTLIKEPKLLLNDNGTGKPEGIHLMIGRRPFAAFGNSTGDQQMLEYTKAGSGLRLSMLVLHDDPKREYAYGPAEKLPDSIIGTFTQALYDEAIQNGWFVISMKNDWNKIFSN